jgi:hypothetical protein
MCVNCVGTLFTPVVVKNSGGKVSLRHASGEQTGKCARTSARFQNQICEPYPSPPLLSSALCFVNVDQTVKLPSCAHTKRLWLSTYPGRHVTVHVWYVVLSTQSVTLCYTSWYPPAPVYVVTARHFSAMQDGSVVRLPCTFPVSKYCKYTPIESGP